jgi:hypothetical protein
MSARLKKLCFYATPAGNLKLKGIGDTLLTQY